MLKIFELERGLRKFAKDHHLTLECNYKHESSNDVMVYIITNPRTNTVKKYYVTEYVFNTPINVESVYKVITHELLRTPDMIDQFKKPIYITTGRAGGKSTLLEQFNNGYFDTDNINYFTQKFEVDPDDMQKVMDNLKSDFEKRVRNDVLDSMRYSWSYLGKYPARKENEKENDMPEMNCEFARLDDHLKAGFRKLLTNISIPEIKKVYFNKPVTVVIWADGTKTIVRAQGKEKYDKEKGLAMAIAKKALGNKGDYYDEFKKWLE